MKHLAALLCLLLLMPLPPSFAQIPAPPPTAAVSFDFQQFGPYSPNFVSPWTTFGYEIGDFHTNYANFERILREYAAKSDRLRVFERGRTPEHRTLYTLVVSSPKNIARLDAIRADAARLADPRRLSDAEAEQLISNMPIIVWLAYSIHGNESAGFEAMLEVLYDLVASQNPTITELLEQAVVVINPCQNPDGHERFVTWYNAVGIGRPEPFAIEHREPWSIYGRLNHYLFDLNRDLVIASQIESQSAMQAFLEWHPQVCADHHGQTVNYFFPPAALPINPNINRGQADKWLDIFGRGNAAAFDRYGWQYYVRDVFDLFYPGYWDSWSSLNGATGMTYETDGGGWKGLNWRRDDETILTLRDGIARHVVASFATLQTAVAHRVERLRDYRAFFVQSIAEGRQGPLQCILFPPEGDATRRHRLVQTLLHHGVEVQTATAAFTLKAVHDYFGGVQPVREFPAGTLVVNLDQPRGRIAKALLEPDTKQDKAFIERQLEKVRRNATRGANAPKEETEFYDITAWSLPLALDVPAYWAGARPTVAMTPLHSVVTTPPPPPSSARTAYVFAYESDAAAKLALRLLQEGYRLATAVRPLRAGDRAYPRGSFILRVERNPDTLHGRLSALAAECGVEVQSVNSAYTNDGITGVGSEGVYTLRPPRIAVIAQEGVSQTSYGALWFTLTNDIGIEFTPITVETFLELRLNEFNVLILPDGSPSAYRRAFGKEGIERLKLWCREGGTLICIGGAAAFAAHKDVDLTGARLLEEDTEEEKKREPDSSADDKKLPQAETAATSGEPSRYRESGSRKAKPKDSKPEDDKPASLSASDGRPPTDAAVAKAPLPLPGAIFRATVNREHFLTFGHEQTAMPVLVSERFFRPSPTGTNVLTIEDPKPLSGFVWEGNTERFLRRTAVVIEEQLGSGHVVLFADDPHYRAIWHAQRRIFLNGLIFGPTITFSTGLR
ncbi:MAG: M14 family zinc carboxypeptidase [Acidobacteriota bacterium]|nr:M14 family zinc carboxypeptidase [Acidobacteriota bacterium]